ncbi:hypothetical protein MSG28_004273 [Choristoneura fumiferana]|uniref:Uncharacterized protein n=1 Tax=Choristoneura fumiferana TaxID=7141 RepID=A0ACC0KJB9_CHOFU|nr:hypothetical protein MSG28_004273 [Choristoneura fumiferana]
MAVTYMVLAALIVVNKMALTNGLTTKLMEIDEAFVEQKDVLLTMLETKLKELKDNKKRKTGAESVKCETMPKNVDMKLRANGISAVGETDLLLKYGKFGNGSLNLNANGISNVGKAQLDLGGGEGSIHIPGLGNLFSGSLSKTICGEQKSNEGDDAKEKPEIPSHNFGSVIDLGYRRSDTIGTNETIGNSMNSTEGATDTTTKDGNFNITSDATTLSEVAANCGGGCGGGGGRARQLPARAAAAPALAHVAGHRGPRPVYTACADRSR